MKKEKQISQSGALKSEVVQDTSVKNTEIAKNNKTDKKQDKNHGKKKRSMFKFLFGKSKEMTSELKKVTWPTFGKVCQKTSVVLAVVIFFFLVLLGIDKLLELALFKVLIG